MTIRIARHTNNIERLVSFYCEILNLKLIGKFENHQNYNGVLLGKDGTDWQLEFTKSNASANHKFDDDDILVFYPDHNDEYDQILENIEKHDLAKLISKNPYWNNNGVMIQDPDGYNIIVSNSKIS